MATSKRLPTTRDLYDYDDTELAKRLNKLGNKIAIFEFFRDFSSSEINERIENLKVKGYPLKITNFRVELEKPQTHIKDTITINLPSDVYTYKFGIISDNHIGSNYERLDVGEQMYDYFKQEGVTDVYNAGNYLDGEKYSPESIYVHGFENQVENFLKKYPKREGITTYLVSGDDHEGWYTQKIGIDLVKAMKYRAKEAGRDDLKFLGYMWDSVLIKHPNSDKTIDILIMHPGGGSSYAVSYKPQKIRESFPPGLEPDLAILGHYHKTGYFYWQGVHFILAGCAKDTDPFHWKMGLRSDLGGWIVEVSFVPSGDIVSITPKWYGFQNNKFKHYLTNPND